MISEYISFCVEENEKLNAKVMMLQDDLETAASGNYKILLCRYKKIYLIRK